MENIQLVRKSAQAICETYETKAFL